MVKNELVVPFTGTIRTVKGCLGTDTSEEGSCNQKLSCESCEIDEWEGGVRVPPLPLSLSLSVCSCV